MRYRHALVTGATSGIGKAIAEALPPDCSLLLTGRNEERLRALQDSLRRPDRKVTGIAADLATPEGRTAVIEGAETAGIDFLINNAGLGRFGPVADNPPAVESEMAAVNVTAPVEITRALLPGMIDRARAGGSRAGIMIVSSVVAFQAVPYMTTYAASKAFDLFYAEGLAEELRDDPVDVLALCPGTTETDFFNRAAMSTESMPYMLSAEKVARMALDAMGRRTVLVTDPARKIMLAPGLLRRYLVRKTAAAFMRRIRL